MGTMKCILCGNNAATFVDSGTTTWNVHDCVLCGGYEITWPLAKAITENRENFSSILPFLRAHTRQASAQGAHVLITYDNFQELARGHSKRLSRSSCDASYSIWLAGQSGPVTESR